MALIAPGVIRFTLSGNIGSGNAWANVWDVRALGGTDDSREDASLAYAKHLIDTWSFTWAARISSSVTLEKVSWVDLNNALGSTGEATDGETVDAPTSGDDERAMAPRNVSVLIRKNTTASRGLRGGRMYVVGIPEADAGEGSIGSTVLSAWTGTANAFLAQVTDPDLDNEFSYLPTIVHTRNDGTEANPNIVYVNNTLITSLSVDATLATQRRRLRR